MSDPGPELQRLVEVTARLRRECPWDARQTHRSLVKHLIEETAEVVEVIEAGSEPDDDQLCEELGDLLMQVCLHAEIAAQAGRFDIADVARGSVDKLVRRHPWVFAAAGDPADIMGTWEQAKQAEKRRTSVLDGVPAPLATLARVQKVLARAQHLGVGVGCETAAEPITAAELGAGIVELVRRAQASGVDADQATRAALRELEQLIRGREETQSR